MSEPRESESVEQRIDRRASQRQRGQARTRRTVWFGLGTFGVVGWSIAVPAALGAFAGMCIDARADRRESWTVMLLLIGLAIGCANAWRWIRRESEESQ